MREIKFRAWNLEDPAMGIIDWDTLSNKDENSGNWDFGIGAIIPSKDWAVMQYTGLKDKNGVEIYEGDILEGKEKGDFGVVNYTAPQFTVYPLSDGIINSLGDGRVNIEKLEFSKVVGNIYESPELLEETK